MMLVTLITDSDVVMMNVWYNSQSQDVLNFHATICNKLLLYTKCISSEVRLSLTQMMGYNEYIPLAIKQMNNAEENLYPITFDVLDSNYSMQELDTQP